MALLHIGTNELISLPDDGLLDIPAKIDTGADSSSIWASNVVLLEGRLQFNLFAPGSTHYAPQPVTTTAFRTVRVKNSFGEREHRYKVKFKVTVGEHVVERWFSLADRSRSTYPVLLGKDFLKNLFVVDVAQKYMHSPKADCRKVLILGAAKSADFYKTVSTYNQYQTQYDVAGFNTLLYKVDGLDTMVTNTKEGNDIAAYDLVNFRSHGKSQEFAGAAADYLHFKGKQFIDTELAGAVSSSKLTEYMRLACHGHPIPLTFCAKTGLLKEHFLMLKKQLGTPFVLKEAASDRGKNNYLIDKETDFLRILAAAPKEHIYVAQKYIPNDGFLRLYVMGKRVVLAISRQTHEHKDQLKRHLNKPAGGANAVQLRLQQIPEEAKRLALQSAAHMNRQIAGVDLLQDKTSQKWYILEVNSAPQMRSGSNTEDKAKALAKFFDKELSK